MKNYKGILSVIVLCAVTNAFARWENMPEDTTPFRGYYSPAPSSSSTYKPAVMPSNYNPALLPGQAGITVMPEEKVEPYSEPVTSIELIEKGVLGDDYASKVKEVLYSGNAKLANKLRSVLQGAIRARYRNDEDRINNLKELIDKEYSSFLRRR